MVTLTRRLLTITLAATSLTCLLTKPAFSQTDGSKAQKSSVLKEVVVTAQRRAQNLQLVPISVSAFSNETLSRNGVTDVGELALLTPGLTMTTSRGSFTTYMRGVGTASSGAGNEGDVPVYIDGVLISDLYSTNFSLPDIKRVEILKGPQGTLFGRNSTGGLINIITRQPSHQDSGSVSLGYGNYQTFTGSAYATGGITDTLAVNGTLYFRRQGVGYGRIIGLPADRANLRVNAFYRNETIARAQLLYTPAADLRVTIEADTQSLNSDEGLVNVIPKGETMLGGVTKQGGFFDSQQSIRSNPEASQYGVSAHIDYDTRFGTFKDITAYRKDRLQQVQSVDGTPLNLLDAAEVADTATVQQELLLIGSNKKFDWTVGFMYFHSSVGDNQLIISPIPTVNWDSITSQKLNSFAGYGQVTYRITDKTHVTGGIRYTSDQRDFRGFEFATGSNPAGAGTVLIDRSPANDPTTKMNDSAPTWRLALDHSLGENDLVYVSYNRGFKSGVFSSSDAGSTAVGPEHIDAYEVGLKSELLEQTLRFNVAVYDNEWKGIQLRHLVNGKNENFNANGAVIRGVEVNSDYIPRAVPGLDLRLAFAYEHGRYLNFPNAPATFLLPVPPGGIGQYAINAGGKETIKTPPYTVSGGVNYVVPVPLGTLGFNVNYTWTDRFYWEIDNRLFEPAYGLLNAQMSLAVRDQKWRITLWGKNLTNVHYAITKFSFVPFGDGFSPGDPLTFGVNINFKI